MFQIIKIYINRFRKLYLVLTKLHKTPICLMILKGGDFFSREYFDLEMENIKPHRT
jgi:hypothetical protein